MGYLKMQEGKPIEEYIDLDGLPNEQNGSFAAKIKGFLDGKYFIPTLIVLGLFTAFFLGRISALDDKRVPVRVVSDNPLNPPARNAIQAGGPYIKGETQTGNSSTSDKSLQNAASVEANNVAGEAVVGSKNGTKYHYPWCAGAKQISQKNLVTFASIEEARAKGYTPAANCKGLK